MEYSLQSTLYIPTLNYTTPQLYTTHFPSTKIYSVDLDPYYDYDACSTTFFKLDLS